MLFEIRVFDNMNICWKYNNQITLLKVAIQFTPLNFYVFLNIYIHVYICYMLRQYYFV